MAEILVPGDELAGLDVDVLFLASVHAAESKPRPSA
jgi:hypothetical protein